MTKRLFDIFFSIFGLIFFFPILIGVAVAIKKSSPGKVFYMGERIGKGGRPFKMYKFRTMVEGAEKMGVSTISINDKRVTKIGKFLRYYHLDEIPQLINILKGDMSFVGPRPDVKEYIDLVKKEDKDIILSILPGVTDYASLWNFYQGDVFEKVNNPRKEYIDNIRPKKTELQIKYVKERNFFVDLKIIIRTIIKVFK